ncbi:MAG TPA: hypothetical protein VFG37_08255, partial [Planctomycetota bacterium]|nr:hypothetical protein [Planctomycetota bacterium]
MRIVSTLSAVTLVILASSLAAQSTAQVSVDSLGNEGGAYSEIASISADGRFVAFNSYASNLVAGDTNGTTDIFVHDRLTGVTERVSVDTAGAEANNGCYVASISPDGRFVAFHSAASNLVSGDTNGKYDVFVHDRVNGITERVSVDSVGGEANDQSFIGAVGPAMSNDGRFVTFESDATNLVGGDTNGQMDIFVHDRITGVTERVSVDSAGGEGDAHSALGTISGDGSLVVFESFATNLVPADANGCIDIFVRERSSGTTQRVSVSPGGGDSDGDSYVPTISADG